MVWTQMTSIQRLSSSYMVSLRHRHVPQERGKSLKLVPNVLDNNGDGFLDETELEALFNKEVLCSCI